MKPNLFIVGAPKCGTTAWARYLKSHPDIFFSELKEPHFFARDITPNQQIRSASEYARLFQKAGKAKIVAEASAMHLFSATAAKAIRDYNPDAKILVFLRDQHDFLRSWHQQMVFACQEPIEDFEAAWRMSGKRPIPKECVDPQLLDYPALAKFPEQLDRYFEAFPAEQIRVFHLDQWSKDPRSAYLEILDFLDLPDDGRTEFPRINEARSHNNRWLAKVISNPPPLAMKAIGVAKKISGRPSFGLGEAALKLVAGKGYSTDPNPGLRREIGDFYKGDNERLATRIWKPDARVLQE